MCAHAYARVKQRGWGGHDERKLRTVAGHRFIRVVTAFAVTLGMALGTGVIAGSAQAQEGSGPVRTDSAIVNGMPVVITELAVKTSNVKDANGDNQNAGEYIELTNMGSSPVPIADITLEYNKVDWTPETFEQAVGDPAKNVQIKPHASVVLWDNYASVSAAGSQPQMVTADDFNGFWNERTHVNPGLVLNSTLFTISKGAGMANTGPRTLVVRQRSTGSSNTITYQNGGTLDTALNVSYQDDGSGTISDNQTPTPGIVSTDQVPASWPGLPTLKMEAEDVSGLPDSVRETDALHLKVKVTSNEGSKSIGSVRLFTKTNVDSAFIDSKFDGVKAQDADVWSFTVPAGTLVARTSLTYRFVVTSDTGAVVDSADRTVQVTPGGPSGKPADAPLVITEIAPDTKNVGGSDGYEFIEVTNVAATDVNFSDNYTLYYSYPDEGSDGDVAWDPVQSDIHIPAGQSAVFWIKNGPNDGLGADDFNKAFALTGDKALTMGKNLFEIKSNGMANNSARTLKVATRTKTLVSQANYPDNASKNLTGDNHSLQYVYSGGQESTLSKTDQNPTPGYLNENDILTQPYTFPTHVTPPSVVDSTPATFDAGKGLRFSFDITSTGGSITRVTLYERNGANGAFSAHNLVRTEGSDAYSLTKNATDLVRVKNVEYYAMVSDGINPEITTATKIVNNPSFDDSPVRLNLADGQFVRGTVAVRGTTDDAASSPALSIDGKMVDEKATSRSVESEPYIAADITQTDIFFMNSFTRNLVVSGTPEGNDWKQKVIGVFDDGTYGSTNTVSLPVPLSDISRDGHLSLYLNSGTKSSPTDILDAAGTVNTENADDYTASNIRLVLPDGRRLSVHKAVAGISPGPSGAVEEERDVTDEINGASNKIDMGDSEGSYEYIRLDFAIDDSSITSRQYEWDTTKIADGDHVITAQAPGAAGASKRITVHVDNTAPTITASVDSQNPDKTSTVKRGEITIEASASDGGSGVKPVDEKGTVGATLSDEAGDGHMSVPRAIELPYRTSSAQLPSGKHQLVFTASDQVGNAVTKTVTFTTPREKPVIRSTAGTRKTGAQGASLRVDTTQESNDTMTAVFHPGVAFTPGDAEITAGQGTTDRSGLSDDAASKARPLNADERKALVRADDRKVSTEGANYGFPFQSFAVKIPDDLAKDAQASATIRWSGSAERGASIYAFVKNVATKGWDQVALVTADDQGKASIEQNVPLKDHVADGSMQVEIQDGAGFTSGEQTNGATPAKADAGVHYAESSTIDGVNGKPVITMNTGDHIDQNETPRSDYDFSFAWETDTQYYNANYDNDGFYTHQKNIHDWLLANRDPLNIQYLFHTGDIVDNADIEDQWQRADEQYQRLDDAKFPYGVLAGNHDVDHKSEDYTNYSKHFGEHRYDANPWYGGSYKNNRGHYDLISAGGIDFIVVSVGWGVGNEEIAWMNKVLAEHSNRVAILNFHEYLLASGGLGLQPQQIFEQVVKKNKNVKIVMSGHYHSAQKTVSKIDDNGDGVPDRNVVNMLFDYQSMAEGGMGFIRLMHINAANATMQVRTYSPSTHKFGSQAEPSSSFKPQDEEFTIDLTQLGVSPRAGAQAVKRLTSDSFRTDVLSNAVIGTATATAKPGTDPTSKSADRNGSYTSTASVDWESVPKGRAGWYVVVSNPYGGTATSAVSYLDPAKDAGGQDGDRPNPDDTQQGDGAGGGRHGEQGDKPVRGTGAQTQQRQPRAVGDLASTGSSPVPVAVLALLLVMLGGAFGVMAVSGRRHRNGSRR